MPYGPIPTVGALILNRHSQVLLLRTHKWSDRWGIPGGKIKRGETSEAALRREIREETALELSSIRFVMVQDCIDPPEFERSAHFLLLNYIAVCADADPHVILNDEAEAYVWTSWEKAFAMPLNIPTRILMEEIARTGLSPS